MFVVVSLYSPDKEDDRWFLELLTESFLKEPSEGETTEEPPLLVPLTPSAKKRAKTPSASSQKRAKKSTTAASSSSSSSSSTAPSSSSPSPFPYKLKIVIHSSSEDNEEEDEGDHPNWMSSRYVYTLQKCRTTARNTEPYSIEHKIH